MPVVQPKTKKPSAAASKAPPPTNKKQQPLHKGKPLSQTPQPAKSNKPVKTPLSAVSVVVNHRLFTY